MADNEISGLRDRIGGWVVTGESAQERHEWVGEWVLIGWEQLSPAAVVG